MPAIASRLHVILYRPVLVLMISLGSLAVAHGGQTARTELLLWNLPMRPAHSGLHAIGIHRLEIFGKEYPRIDLSVGGGPQLQRFGRGTREFLMAQAAGTAPDAVEMSDVDLQDFISRGFLAPLDGYLKEAGILDQARADPLARHYLRGNHIYAVPIRPKPQAYVLLYRKDYFRRVGLDPEKPPTTWAEFLRCAELLTDPPNSLAGFVLPTIERKGPLEAGGFLELMFALNGVDVIHDTSDSWSADFADDERAVQVMQFVKELIGRRIKRDGKTYRGLVATSAGTVDDAYVFAALGGAMMIQPLSPDVLGNLVLRRVPMEDIGIAPLPLGPSGEGYIPLAPRYIGINSTSPTEERRGAAWEWIRFNRRDDLLAEDARTLVNWGMPALMDPTNVGADRSLLDAARNVPDHVANAYRRRLEHTRPLPMCSEHRRLRQDYLARPIWELLKNPDRDIRKLLVETEDQINKEVLGIVPRETRASRERIALIVVIAVAASILVGLTFGIGGMARALSAERIGSRQRRGRGLQRKYLLAILFMIPAVGSVMLWMYLPLIRGAMIAFQDYQIIGQSRWAGLDNFIDVLTDKLFWVSLLRTAQYATISLSLGFVAPIILAFFLSEVPRGKVLFRVLFFLPGLTSALIVSFLWFWIYKPGQGGLLNTLLAHFGQLIGLSLGPYDFLGSEHLAMISVILPAIWGGLGPGSIIYLAALHGVPEEMYEAADLDGAGAWSKAWNVAIPFIRPLVLINFIGAVIGTMYATQSIFVMTMGGPGNATYVTGLYIFLNSFVWLKFGKATAAAWILGSLLVGFMVYQLRILRDMRFQTAGKVDE